MPPPSYPIGSGAPAPPVPPDAPPPVTLVSPPEAVPAPESVKLPLFGTAATPEDSRCEQTSTGVEPPLPVTKEPPEYGLVTAPPQPPKPPFATTDPNETSPAFPPLPPGNVSAPMAPPPPPPPPPIAVTVSVPVYSGTAKV